MSWIYLNSRGFWSPAFSQNWLDPVNANTVFRRRPWRRYRLNIRYLLIRIFEWGETNTLTVARSLDAARGIYTLHSSSRDHNQWFSPFSDHSAFAIGTLQSISQCHPSISLPDDLSLPECADVHNKWLGSKLEANLQLHILTAIYGSKISLTSLHRVLGVSLIFYPIFSPLMHALQVYHLIVDKLKVLDRGNGEARTGLFPRCRNVAPTHLAPGLSGRNERQRFTLIKRQLQWLVRSTNLEIFV
jgi:hypothetical protein